MNMQTNYKGGCLCGKIKFEISGKIRDIIYCHCSQCRRAQGSAFATNGNVTLTDFHFIEGEQYLTGYQATPGQTKYFCKFCGSPIISKNEALPEKVRVRLGTIDSDINERPAAHIFVASKANWEEICGDLPRYPECEPDR
jgi:hypothetical protein